MKANFVNIFIKKTPSTTVIIPVEAHYSRRTISNGFCLDRWLKFIRRVEKDPNCYVVFVGDTLDSDRPTTRIRKAIMYAEPDRKSALSEDDLDHQRGLRVGIIKDLKRIKHKILGMVDGDHYRLYNNGTTSTWYIANQLGIPNVYLGERMGWIRLVFKMKERSDSLMYTILVRHGKGGTGKIGADINRLIDQNCDFTSELFIGGHTHKDWFYKKPQAYLGKNETKYRHIGYARAGSFLRSFVAGQELYPEKEEFSPLEPGFPEIFINILRTRASNGNMFIESVKGLT